MEDNFVAKDYDAAVKTCVDAVAEKIADIYNASLEMKEFQQSNGAAKHFMPQ